MPFVYILRCADGSFYVGHTDDVDARLETHHEGGRSDCTAAQRPVQLVYSEACGSLAAAIRLERQLKRWSGKKKEALTSRDLTLLHTLSRRRNR
jgi:tRNA/rRNA methyltransferase